MNQLYLMSSSANALVFVKELTLLKIVLQYQAADANHGVKKELDVLVKGLSALHNGVAVVSYSVQLLVHMLTNFHVKFVD